MGIERETEVTKGHLSQPAASPEKGATWMGFPEEES